MEKYIAEINSVIFEKENLSGENCFGSIHYGIFPRQLLGALVWFAHIIEWEFPGFTVKDSLDRLFHLQNRIEKEGVIEGKIHRFLLIARKRLLD